VEEEEALAVVFSASPPHLQLDRSMEGIVMS
jgi:hypothetical protein